MEHTIPSNKPLGPPHLRVAEVEFLKPQVANPRTRKDNLVAAMRDTEAMIKAMEGKS